MNQYLIVLTGRLDFMFCELTERKGLAFPDVILSMHSFVCTFTSFSITFNSIESNGAGL